MEILKNVTLVLHFVGLASLLGGFLVQMSARSKRIDPAMFHGALTMLVTGVALVGIDQAMDDPHLNNTKVAVKLLVLVVITVLVLMNRKKPAIPVGLWAAVGGLTLLNVVLAVFW